MKILKLMTRNPKTVSPEATLEEAAKIMRRINAGALPVVENGGVIGMITDRDITIRSVSEGQDPTSTTVREAMTQSAVFCYDDENIHEAGKAMLSENVGRLPVLSRKNLKLAGIISLADIIGQCGGKRIIEGKSSTASKLAIPAFFALAAFGAYANRSRISSLISDTANSRKAA